MGHGPLLAKPNHTILPFITVVVIIKHCVNSPCAHITHNTIKCPKSIYIIMFIDVTGMFRMQKQPKNPNKQTKRKKKEKTNQAKTKQSQKNLWEVHTLNNNLHLLPPPYIHHLDGKFVTLLSNCTWQLTQGS